MRLIYATLACTLLSFTCVAEEVTLVSGLIEKVRALREALGPAQSGSLQFEFDDKARTVWSFFPGEHPGIALADCSEAQKAAMLDCVRLALSASGFAKTELVRSLDDVLAQDNPTNYSSGNYFLSIWGEPGEKGPWSMRWEGHHLSLNWLIKDGRIMSSTPQFLGSNPAKVLEGPLKDTRVQAQEEDLARALLQSFDERQRTQAVAGPDAIADVLTHMKSDAEPLEEVGLPYTELNEAQQAMLRELIEVYIQLQAAPIAEQRANALTEEALAQVRFAWFGGTEIGDKHYYRIHGSGWVIEYANTQNNANHIHTTWRDFSNDFGRDILREHLARFHPEDSLLGW